MTVTGTGRVCPPEESKHADGAAGLSGEPLAPRVRTTMESVVGAPLGEVHVHNDVAAVERVGRRGALATTYGNEVDLGTSAPSSSLDRTVLLAHELAHVRQQHVGGATERGQLERQADAAAIVAAIGYLDATAGGRVSPRFTGGRGLGLQACAAADGSDIGRLPSRADYESRGALAPRSDDRELDLRLRGSLFDLTGSGGGGMVVDGTSGAVPDGRTREALPDPRAMALELDPYALSARLSVMLARQEEIDELTSDVEGRPITPAVGLSFLSHDAAAGTLVDPTGPLATTSRNLDETGALTALRISQELPRAEVIQRRVLRELLDVADLRRVQTASMGPLVDRGYDLPRALGDIDLVQWAYYRTTAELFTPRSVDRLRAADAQRDSLDHQLTEYLVDYYGQLSGDSGIAPVTAEMQSWVAAISQDLTELRLAAEDLRDAREAEADDVTDRAHRVADSAQLVAVGLEALATWDVALSAYQYLSDNTALYGFAGIEQITARLSQMKQAYLDRDEPYLALLVRDHRTDPEVSDFYDSLPDIVADSHMIIGLAILLVAVIATAGIGVLIEGVAIGVAGATTAGQATLVLQAGVVAQVVGEALVFTAVDYGLRSLVPGMKPEHTFLYELAWNLAMFGALKRVGRAVGRGMRGSARFRALGEVAARRVLMGVQAVTSYPVLEAYGYLRFAYERRRSMTGREFLAMSGQNLVILAGLTLATAPLGPVMESVRAGGERIGSRGMATLQALRARYGGRTRSIEAQRTRLEERVSARMADERPLEADEIADFESEAAILNEGIDGFVQEVMGDPAIDLSGLRTDLSSLSSVVQSTPLPELLQSMGIEPVLDVRATGDPATWTMAAGEGRALEAALGELGIATELVREAPTVLEVSLPLRGRVTFVERPGAHAEVPLVLLVDPRPDPQSVPADAPPVGPAVTWTAPMERAPVTPPDPGPNRGVISHLDTLLQSQPTLADALAAVRAQSHAPSLVSRLEAALAGESAGQARVLLDILVRLVRQRTGADGAGGLGRGEALALDAALGEARAGDGLRRLAGRFPARYRSALASILEAVPPENVAVFLRANAEPGLSGPAEFFQGLGRNRAACELVDRFGSRLLWRLLRLQPGRVPPAMRVSRARLDIDRVLTALDRTSAEDPVAAIALADRITGLRSNATPRALDALVGRRARQSTVIEPHRDDPQWPVYRSRADAYAAAHPVEGPALTRAELDLRAALFQVVARAQAGDFAAARPAERTAMLDDFNALSAEARLDRSWISAMRGRLFEGLGRGNRTPSLPTIWLGGRVVRSQLSGSTVPDAAYPPVTYADLTPDASGRVPVETTPRRWIEQKAYTFDPSNVDANGVNRSGRTAARSHVADATADLGNLPPGSTIELEYSRDPGEVTRDAMARILFAEPRVERVTFAGETLERGDLGL